jgi:hypothetical protein
VKTQLAGKGVGGQVQRDRQAKAELVDQLARGRRIVLQHGHHPRASPAARVDAIHEAQEEPGRGAVAVADQHERRTVGPEAAQRPLHPVEIGQGGRGQFRGRREGGHQASTKSATTRSGISPAW